MATYPPVVKIAAGRSAARMAVACGTDAPSRIGSRTGWTSRSVVRSDRAASRRSGMPGGRDELRLEAAVAAEPAQVRRVVAVSARSDRATARAG